MFQIHTEYMYCMCGRKSDGIVHLNCYLKRIICLSNLIFLVLSWHTYIAPIANTHPNKNEQNKNYYCFSTIHTQWFCRPADRAPIEHSLMSFEQMSMCDKYEVIPEKQIYRLGESMNSIDIMCISEQQQHHNKKKDDAMRVECGCVWEWTRHINVRWTQFIHDIKSKTSEKQIRQRKKKPHTNTKYCRTKS